MGLEDQAAVKRVADEHGNDVVVLLGTPDAESTQTLAQTVVTVVILLGLGCVYGSTALAPARAADGDTLPGTATLTGVVNAPKPFKAARVHLMNVDKNVLFMVYTSGGRYRAVNLFPGNYEVTVLADGLAGNPQKIELAAGAGRTLDITLREGPALGVRQGEFGFTTQRPGEVQLVAYDELYPREPGRVLLEKQCMYCHGKSFFPSKQYHETQWSHFIDQMQDGGGLRGALIPPGTLSAPDRATIVAYLGKHFGPSSPKRGLKADTAFPVDEATLAKAMYVEYYLPLDPTLDAGNKQRRTQEPHFDPDGNVWYTDRSVPNRIGRVDPRTAEVKDWMMPDAKADPHGLTVDRNGHVFWAETVGFSLGRLDPKTGSITRYPMDSTGRSKGRGHTPVVDSKDNVWFTEFRRCKIGKFDPRTEKFTEYAAPTQPCTIRRLGVDSTGMVWYGGFNNGKLGKLDPNTGKIVEYDIPMAFSEPYDVWPDREDRIWISDGGQGGALIRFDPKTEKFTYYPTPQITDQPKLAITRDGAVGYTPRSSSRAAAGVLYPDVTKITTLGAYY